MLETVQFTCCLMSTQDFSFNCAIANFIYSVIFIDVQPTVFNAYFNFELDILCTKLKSYWLILRNLCRIQV